MSALQFLNKKSWHTATIKNNEKVWLKEQAAENEKKRMEELQKQLAEERKLQEIQRLEEKSGRLDPAELLKRRRLNWMYEHGPNKDDEKQQEKDREDTLLGRKEVNLEELEQPLKRTSLAEEERKLREDPLVQIEMERARILRLAGRDPLRRVDPEREAKRKRKEQRAKIREERRIRREKRALRRSGRPNARESEERGRENGRGPGDGKTSHEREMDRMREIERQLLAEINGSPQKCDEERSPPTKRRRSDSRERYEDEPHHTRQDEGRRQSRDRPYGLSLPENGSGVAVSHEFVPRARRRRWDERGDEARVANGERNNRSVSPQHRRRHHSRSVLDAGQRERRLAEMRRDADRIEEERRGRIRKYASEEREERRDDYARRDPTRSFARDCISAGTAKGSTADRIRQRRAWATRDSDARY